MPTLRTGKDTNIIQRFINHPDGKRFLEIKMSFPDFTCTYGRMRVYGRYAPEFVIIIELILSLNCPFPTSRNPHFGSEGKCKNFPVKMSFICMKKKKNIFPLMASHLASL